VSKTVALASRISLFAVAIASLVIAAPTGNAAVRTFRLIYTGSTPRGIFLDLFRANVNGTGVVNLTRTSGFDEEWPEASPDGSRIVFRGGTQRFSSTEIYTAKADGSSVRQLTFNDAGDEAPVWSPDGNQVLFASNINDRNHECTSPPCNWDLYRVNADGTGLTQLTSSPSGEIFGSYSPDGSTIAYSSIAPTGEAAIYAMPSGGGTAVQLTPEYLGAAAPEYSPDGSKIAFIDNATCACVSHIWVMNADGGGRTQLTTGDAYNDLTPAWSPDGKQIAISRSAATGDTDVWVMSANGSRLRDVTNAPGTQTEPDWLP
jgi:dipeptidyl aminopeptidase/acylaminoacyl peptidase